MKMLPITYTSPRSPLAGCAVLTTEPGVGEHAGLGDDVLPLARGAQRSQLLEERLSHEDDTVCHRLHMVLPTADTQMNEGWGDGWVE
jgi:hypothetical protein